MDSDKSKEGRACQKKKKKAGGAQTAARQGQSSAGAAAAAEAAAPARLPPKRGGVLKNTISSIRHDLGSLFNNDPSKHFSSLVHSPSLFRLLSKSWLVPFLRISLKASKICIRIFPTRKDKLKLDDQNIGTLTSQNIPHRTWCVFNIVSSSTIREADLPPGRNHLDWNTRMRIAAGVAKLKRSRIFA
ncbi:hypothetical protein H6P81_001235 [Aristolochia fimbriata]|uniref:Uncharacterized protein n=1 Tax=Aristolochia fimbriata TaxID=158543 RepID=A0AAV7F6F2_ARIFI|nr:hypothetical protein H6P81_001235 [Aristolochia fimbriata]